MDNLQKQTWHDRLLAVVWASCGILPLPFGAFASDRPYIASASILAFFILSFAVPLWLGYRRRRAGRDGDYASSGATLYGGAVVLLVAFVGFVIIQGVEGMTPEMLSFAPMAWAICSLTRCTSSFWLSSAV